MDRRTVRLLTACAVLGSADWGGREWVWLFVAVLQEEVRPRSGEGGVKVEPGLRRAGEGERDLGRGEGGEGGEREREGGRRKEGRGRERGRERDEGRDRGRKGGSESK